MILKHWGNILTVNFVALADFLVLETSFNFERVHVSACVRQLGTRQLSFNNLHISNFSQTLKPAFKNNALPGL